MFLCFWSDSKYLFTIFLVPPLIHTQKTYTNLTLCIVIHILFHTSHIANDLCRTTKYYHIKQQYTAIPASLTLITPLIGRINTSARSQHTSRDRIDPPGHTPADLHPLISSRRRHSVAVSSLDYVSHQLPGLLHQLHPAAVGGGLITLCVIYLLSHQIARIGSNPSTFAVPIDPYRTRGSIEIAGDAATPAAAASIHQAFAISPVNLHNDPTTASVSTPASYHKQYKNTVKRRRFFRRRKSIV